MEKKEKLIKNCDALSFESGKAEVLANQDIGRCLFRRQPLEGPDHEPRLAKLPEEQPEVLKTRIPVVPGDLWCAGLGAKEVQDRKENGQENQGR